MRRHPKAPSVASTLGRVSRLGVFLRGAFATRGASSEAGGSSAPSFSAAPVRLLALLGLAAMGAALMAAPALGAKTRAVSFSFGSDGTAGTSFVSIQGVAVDQASGEAYVHDQGDGGKVYKFDAAGNPVSFSALAGNVIEGVGGSFGAENQIAVAPPGSPGGTAGDIYVAGGGAIKIYDDSGTKIGDLTGGFICGVAVDAAGHVFAGVYPETVREFTPTGSPATNADQTSASTGVVSAACNVAADGLGNVYAARYFGGVQKLEGLGDASATLLDPDATTLGMDPASNDLFANKGSSVAQYDSSGALLGSFGAGQLSQSRGIAVNSAAEEIYVGDNGSGKVDVFGPTTIVPGVSPEPPSVVTSAKATLNGLVNPDGVAVTDCKFEYGPTTAYGSTKPCEGAIPTDSSDHPVSAGLTGLTLNTTYHFRVVATNANGSNQSSDSTFTTRLPAVTGDATAITGTEATLNGVVFPEGLAVTDCKFEYGPTESYGNALPCVGAIPTDEGEHAVTAAVTGLALNTAYHYRLVFTNANGTVEGVDRSFGTLGAAIESQSAIDVGVTEVTLRTRINPRGLPTTYHIEYGAATSYGQSTSEISVGSDATAHTMTRFLQGLTPATTYHWRVVATNSAGSAHGPDRTFITRAPLNPESSCPNQQFRIGLSASLPDCRTYEMVSPLDKNNGDIITRLNVTGYPTGINQSAIDGSGFTYSSYRSFANPQGAPYTAQYLARRDPGSGWQSESIDAVRDGHFRDELEGEYQAFSEDLSSGWLVHEGEPTLAPCAPAGFAGIYRRDNASGTYRSLNCAQPSLAPVNFLPEFQGFSADGSNAVFRVDDTLTPDASSAGNYQVYMSDAAGELHLVSVLPNGEAATINASAGTSFEAALQNHNRIAVVDHAISADGTRVFWSHFGPFGPGPLYLRVNADQEQTASGACDEAGKACTIPVAQDAAFQTANAAGTKALYLSVPARDLYEFDAEADPPVSRLIAKSLAGTGMVGASADLSRVFFTSREASPAAEAEGAVVGGFNVYLAEEGTTRFVATLADADQGISEGLAVFRNSRVSADGQHLVFVSNSKALSESVAGYDNTDAASDQPDTEVYLYDSGADGGSGKLRCVSCNPSGARPLGHEIPEDSLGAGYWAAARVPKFQNQFLQGRYLSDDGSRVFFNSFDALVLGDTNGKQDVYEWEAAGSGSCTVGSPAYAASSDGCISLLTSGQSPFDSEFLEASPSGSDVFFTTAESLLPQDNGLVDIYDARVGGGFAPPPGTPPACEGEACQGPLVPPNDPTPASAAFNGAGNVKPAAKSRCAKGKARRKGRCVAKKHRKGTRKSSKQRADNERRAGR